jgi:hypothetical protein
MHATSRRLPTQGAAREKRFRERPGALVALIGVLVALMTAAWVFALVVLALRLIAAIF